MRRDLKFALVYIDENFYKFTNQTVTGLLSEYCLTDGDEQKEVYENLVDAFKSIDK
ncbi:hypothetical protein AVEN_11453-1, partial [Araneus ventricosus]